MEPLLALLQTSAHLTSVKLGQGGGILAQFDSASLKRLQPFGHTLEKLSFDFMGCGAPVLRTISSKMSTRDICDFLRHCPNLHHFSVHCNSMLALFPENADMMLTTIADNCPLLRRLNFNGVEGFTDAGLSALTQKCKHLQHLSMFGCREFTNASYQFIAQLEELEHLELVWQPHINPQH